MHKPILGYGLCECGCGATTRTDAQSGKPRRFVRGHHSLKGPVRYWGFVPTRPADACWEWQGATDINGYGTFGNQKAHRLMFEHAAGPIPKGHGVLHTCDNPPCVNPAHLFTGTQADNVADMVAKDRVTRYNAKVTADDVRDMRRRYEAGGVSQASLAREYGLAGTYVHKIVKGKSWKALLR